MFHHSLHQQRSCISLSRSSPLLSIKPGSRIQLDFPSMEDDLPTNCSFSFANGKNAFAIILNTSLICQTQMIVGDQEGGEIFWSKDPTLRCPLFRYCFFFYRNIPFVTKLLIFIDRLCSGLPCTSKDCIC